MLRRIALLALLATLLGGMFAIQSIVALPAEQQSAEWPRLLTLQMLFWYSWVAITPLAFVAADRLRINTSGLARRLLLWIVLGLLIAALHTAVYMGARMIVDPLQGHPFTTGFGHAWWWWFKRSITQDSLDIALIAAAYHVMDSFRRERQRERVQAELTMRLTTAELGLLRMQLHPHFLFNALNTVSGLMVTDTEAARALLADVGELFRLSLERLGKAEVTLSDEVEFIRRYLEIQRLRFGERLAVDIAVDPDVQDALVPSLILQPIVENAVRHGVEPRRGMVTVRVSASREGDRLVLTVEDDGAGIAQRDRAAVGQGIGLSNTRSRLTQMYGTQGMMNAGARTADGSGYRVVMSIPYESQLAEVTA